MRYSVVVEKANENYSAYVPDLPGCVATGDTIESVQREIRQAIGLHVQGLKEDGLTVPEPTSVVDYIDIGSETEQTAASLISNDVPIEKPEDDQYGIDAFAEAIAASIEKLFAPEGTVFALTGPWGSGMGDRVSRGLPQVQIEGLDSILNVNRFLSCKSEVEARLLAEHEKQILARFNEGMQRREEEQRRRGEQTNFPREGHETNNEDIDIDDELQQ